MTVEMERPFVWPEVPDLEMWDNKVYKGTMKERVAYEESMAHDASTHLPKDRISIAEQAKLLLKGENSWKSGNTKNEWINVGEEVEVETDVQLPKTER